MTDQTQKQTTIIRAPRDKENPYFALRRKTAQDDRLSFEARGTLAYLLSRPGDWDINEEDLMREGHCGRDRIRRILKELKTCGYLIREAQTRNKQERFNPVVLRVQEIPSPENPSTASGAPLPENPSTGEPSTDEPSTENPTHTYKRESTEGQSSQTEEDKGIPSTTESVPPARDVEPPTGVGVVVDEAGPDDDAWSLIRTDIAALALSPAREIALRALGPAPALAIAMAADKPGVKSPSGLAVSLITHPENIPQTLLDQAVERFVRHADQLHPAPAPPTPEEPRADLAQLEEAVQQVLAERALAPESSEPESKIDTLSNLPASEQSEDGLDFQAPGHSLTMREIWQAVITNVPSLMGPQAVQLYRGTQAKRYANGVLTVQAPSPLARDLFNRNHASWGLEVAKWAGMPVEVKAI